MSSNEGDNTKPKISIQIHEENKIEIQEHNQIDAKNKSVMQYLNNLYKVFPLLRTWPLEHRPLKWELAG